MKHYRRETNTMPNWAGSCWYELRYLDPANFDALVDPEVEKYWMGKQAETVVGAPAGSLDPGGADLYVGGVEHAVLHLLYSRFWHKVLFDLGYVSSEEPFRKLFNQGYVQAFAYRDGLDIALVEQLAERFLAADVAQVEQHLVPEAGVQQVQHGVLDPTDIQIGTTRVDGTNRCPHNGFGVLAHPVLLHLGVNQGVVVGRIQVAQLVPAGTGPVGHGVGLAAVGLHAVAQVQLDVDPFCSQRQGRRRGGHGVLGVERGW